MPKSHSSGLDPSTVLSHQTQINNETLKKTVKTREEQQTLLNDAGDREEKGRSGNLAAENLDPPF